MLREAQDAWLDSRACTSAGAPRCFGCAWLYAETRSRATLCGAVDQSSEGSTHLEHVGGGTAFLDIA
jgi:hypothetical protein